MPPVVQRRCPRRVRPLSARITAVAGRRRAPPGSSCRGQSDRRAQFLHDPSGRHTRYDDRLGGAFRGPVGPLRGQGLEDTAGIAGRPARRRCRASGRAAALQSTRSNRRAGPRSSARSAARDSRCSRSPLAGHGRSRDTSRPRPRPIRAWATPAPGPRAGRQVAVAAPPRWRPRTSHPPRARRSVPRSGELAPRRRGGASRLDDERAQHRGGEDLDAGHARGDTHGVEPRQLDQPRKRRLVPEAMSKELAIGPEHEDGGEHEQGDVEDGSDPARATRHKAGDVAAKTNERVQRQARAACAPG